VATEQQISMHMFPIFPWILNKSFGFRGAPLLRGWEGSTFSEKVKHAPPAAAAPAAPAAPAPPAPVGAFGFRLPPPGTEGDRRVYPGAFGRSQNGVDFSRK